MSSFNRIIEKLNFKKIFVGYIILSLVAGILCAGWVGYVYRDKINLSFTISRSAKDWKRGVLILKQLKCIWMNCHSLQKILRIYCF